MIVSTSLREPLIVMKTCTHLKPLLALALLLALSGCNTAQKKPVAPAPLSEAQKASNLIEQKGQTLVVDGITLYQAGYYDKAESKFLAPDVWAASPRVRVDALKHLAFTYCVSERPRLCRQAFERALQLDPNFSLDAAESSHPLWGPEFKLATAQSK